jgi:hypothetical protein
MVDRRAGRAGGGRSLSGEKWEDPMADLAAERARKQPDGIVAIAFDIAR